MNTNIIKLDLYNNAMDSFIIAIDAFIRGECLPTYYKISIKEMFAAFELILKDILKDEHEAFIYENVEDIRKPIDERRTVKFDNLLSRLNSRCNYSLEDRYLQIIQRLKKLRNMSQHSTFEINKYNAADIISKSVPIMIHIIKEYYDDEIDLDELLGEEYSKQFIKIKSAVKALHADAQKRFEEDNCKEIKINRVKSKCVFCESTLIINDGEHIKCYCCHKTFKVEDFFQVLVELDSDFDQGVYECPSCGLDAMFEHKPYQQLVCLNCGKTSTLTECSSCLDYFPLYQLNDVTDYYGIKPPDEITYLCDSCKLEQDYNYFEDSED